MIVEESWVTENFYVSDISILSVSKLGPLQDIDEPPSWVNKEMKRFRVK